MTGTADLRGRVEAVLFVADVPVAAEELVEIVGADAEEIRSVLAGLQAEYAAGGRGFELRAVAGGWRLYTSDRYSDVVERYVLEGQTARLSTAALETLAVVAYRQPVTRARVAAIRGVGVDGVFRTLLSHGLIEESGSEAAAGAHLYRTTSTFLETFGLRDVTELPSLAPLLPESAEYDDAAFTP